MTVTIDKFGRVLIPKPLRDQLGLAAGAELSLDVQTGGDGAPALELRAVPDAPPLVRKNGRLVYTGAIDPEGQDIVAFIQEQRLSRTRQLAGVEIPGVLSAHGLRRPLAVHPRLRWPRFRRAVRRADGV